MKKCVNIRISIICREDSTMIGDLFNLRNRHIRLERSVEICTESHGRISFMFEVKTGNIFHFTDSCSTKCEDGILEIRVNSRVD